MDCQFKSTSIARSLSPSPMNIIFNSIIYSKCSEEYSVFETTPSLALLKIND